MKATLGFALATVVCCASLGCSSGGSGGGGNGGAGGSGAAGSGGTSAGGTGAGGSGGATCNGITGTYAMTRTRDATNPGSCPPTYTYNPSMPGKVVADATKPSGFDVQIGYTTNTGALDYTSCTNNVTGCKIFATCTPSAGTDQITLTISGNKISGTLLRTSSGQGCSAGGTVNFNVSGTRQ